MSQSIKGWMEGHSSLVGRRNSSFGDIGARLEAKLGKLPFSGRYHVEPRLLTHDYVLSSNVCGSGFNGEVKIASSVSLPGQKFAVKSLSIGSSMQNVLHKEKLEQLKAEVENYLLMDHPHIIRLYDVYETRQELHLVMECAEGGELFDHVTTKKRFSRRKQVTRFDRCS
jgi:serine/threonine protein kinase